MHSNKIITKRRWFYSRIVGDAHLHRCSQSLIENFTAWEHGDRSKKDSQGLDILDQQHVVLLRQY